MVSIIKEPVIRCRKCWANVGDSGNDAAANGMLGDHDGRVHSLGMCGADIVLIEHFQHAAAGDSRQVGGCSQAKGKSRENPVKGVTPAGDFKKGNACAIWPASKGAITKEGILMPAMAMIMVP